MGDTEMDTAVNIYVFLERHGVSEQTLLRQVYTGLAAILHSEGGKTLVSNLLALILALRHFLACAAS